MSEVKTAIDQLIELANSIGADINWLWFYIQVAVLISAATMGAAVSVLVRRKFDLVSLTMGWPATLRRVVRAFVDNFGFVIFIILISAVYAVMLSMTWPSRSYLLGIALNLASAWVVINVLASQIRNKLAFRTVALSAWLVAALSILGLVDQSIAALDAFAVNFGDLKISALLVIKTVVLLSITLWIATGVGNYFDRKIRSAADISASLQVLIGKLVKLFLFTLTIVIVLNSVGIDLSALVVFSGAVGVGLGFGLQKIVSNFVSGIILLADKSIKPGDVISVGESFGWVEAMGARYSSVVARDGREFLIPNEDLVTQRVVNWSHSNDRIRTRCAIWLELRMRPACGPKACRGSHSRNSAGTRISEAGVSHNEIWRFITRFRTAFLDKRSHRGCHQCAWNSDARIMGCVQTRRNRNSLPGARSTNREAATRCVGRQGRRKSSKQRAGLKSKI